MKMRLPLGLALALLVVSAAGAAAGTPPPRARAKTVAAGSGDPQGRAAGPRKLEDIHIEGQMPAPQVLFITARDQRRFLDFQHARYLRSARAIGEDVRMPRHFVVSTRGAAPAAEAEVR